MRLLHWQRCQNVPGSLQTVSQTTFKESRTPDPPLDITLTEYAADVPPYAILSHRWDDPQDEVSYQDLIVNPALARQKKGCSKIYNTCKLAEKYGYHHVWIDTCCIDKSSSAELSEAINSMFRWYWDSAVCFAYLNDVPSDEDPIVGVSSFQKSAWFTRGWTLQELIAPHKVMFLAKDWEYIGERSSLADIIKDITTISRRVLEERPFGIQLLSFRRFPIATKMSWAANRKTTRVEDRAYSLLGLFEVNMPPLYGEGDRAFTRLQQEIMRISVDHTIFAWQSNIVSSGMIATSMDQFSSSTEYKPVDYGRYVTAFEMQDPKPDYSMTNSGVHIQLPIVAIPNFSGYYLAALACAYASDSDNLMRSSDLGNCAVIFLMRLDTLDRIQRFARISFNGRSVDYLPRPNIVRWDIQSIWVSGMGAPGHPRPYLNSSNPRDL
jgi:hypothetical protein